MNVATAALAATMLVELEVRNKLTQIATPVIITGVVQITRLVDKANIPDKALTLQA
jgi:hypothetical protein